MLKPTKRMKQLVKFVWKNKEEGVHTWYKHHNNYITIECLTEDFATNEPYDYILVTECNEIDSLGYPLDVIDILTFEEEDIK